MTHNDTKVYKYSMIDSFYEQELTYAIAIDEEYEYFLIAHKDPKAFMKTFHTIGKCYRGNTFGEFLVYDFDELKEVYENVVDPGITVEEALNRIERCKNNDLNPWDSPTRLSNPHVNLLLVDFYVKLYNLIVNNRENERITDINFSIDKVIDEYKSVQASCIKFTKEVLYLPKEEKLHRHYQRCVFMNRLSVIVPSGSFELLDEYSRQGFISLRTTEADDTNSATIWFIPNTLSDATNYLLNSYLENDIHFRVCSFCGRPFALVKKYNSNFCTRPIDDYGDYVHDYEEIDEEHDTEEEIARKITKTCKNYGRILYYKHQNSPQVWLKEKVPPLILNKSDESRKINREYMKSYKAHYARMQKGSMTKPQFSEWHREAIEMRDLCKTGIMTIEEFIDWLNKDRLRKPRKTKEKD